ncbi:MAG: hypothetical protein ACKOOG_05235, partial [Actinomycetota bacterium]
RPGGASDLEAGPWPSRLQHRAARPGPAVGRAPHATAVEAADAPGGGFADYAASSIGKRSLAALALELTLVCACASDVVAGLVVDEHWVVVRRGPAALEPGSFVLADHSTDPGGGSGPR